MGESPFVSVMILCYNYSSLLKKALEACAAQTDKDFEIVMINNGSTDDTELVFKNFCCNYPDISTQYVKVEQNQGPTHGWNVGLPYAKGKYLLFNDADDWMEPNCISELKKAAEESGADRIVGQYQEVLPDGRVNRIRKIKKKTSRIPTAMLQGVLFCKDIVFKNELKFPEDVFIPYDVAFYYSFVNCETTNPFFVRKVVYDYYFNPESICQKAQQENYYINLLENLYSKLINITADSLEKVNNKEIYNEMEYICLRNNYSAIFYAYKLMTVNEADKFYEEIHKLILSKLPDYKYNPLLWPINNGYEFSGGFAVWILIKTENLGIIKPFCRTVSKISLGKFFRKNENK